jgi:hypothetical protein
LYFPEEKDSALWPFLLLSLFPFSIFYSLYFTEALFLLLSIGVFILFKSEKYFLMALSGFLLSLARPTGMFIAIPVLFGIYTHRKTLSAPSMKGKYLPYACAVMMPSGFLAYVFFIYLRTGYWNFYSEVLKKIWGGVADLSLIGGHIANHVFSVIDFFSHPLHSFHFSKIETFMMVFFGVVLAAMWSNRKFPRELTLWATLIWFVPLAVKGDLMSYSRYVSVSFPVFLFLGLRTGWVDLYMPRQPRETFRYRPTRDTAILILLFASIALLVFYRIQDFDFFWHVANGKFMVHQGRIINEEIFSFTRPGVSFSNHEWLAQIVFYLIFSSLGSLGIVAFKTLIVRRSSV